MAYITTTHRPSIADWFRAQLASFRKARERRALYNRTVAELSVLTDRDLADLGISRHSIDDLAFDHAYRN